MRLSERRACRIVGADRKIIRYLSFRPPEAELCKRLRVQQLIQLAFLAPVIIGDVRDGKQPVSLTSDVLMRMRCHRSRQRRANNSPFSEPTLSRFFPRKKPKTMVVTPNLCGGLCQGWIIKPITVDSLTIISGQKMLVRKWRFRTFGRNRQNNGAPGVRGFMKPQIPSNNMSVFQKLYYCYQ